jgi:hypothetical protein
MTLDRCTYYGTRFSPNLTATPEGFLICHAVPVARTGWYEYLASEIGASGNDVVRVYRSPEEVFDAAAIASFQGMPATDDHPPEPVSSENATVYTKGSVQNVRQGNGEESDLLLADLVIYDKRLIDDIMAGKREVSCGYMCNYADNGDGTYSQTGIRGNHVAIVSAGRAGDRVAIKDAKGIAAKAAQQLQGDNHTNQNGRNTSDRKKEAKPKMPKMKSKKSFRDMFAALGFKQFAADAEPEEIMDAMESLAADSEGDEEEARDADPAVAALTEQVNKLTEMVASLMGGKEADPMDAVNEEIKRLEGGACDDDDPDGSATIEASEMVDDNEPGPVSPSSERPESAFDNAYKLQALKAIKPIIAAIPDPKARKQAADAALAAIGARSAKKAYSGMVQSRQKPAQDGKQQKAVDHSELGRKIAEQHNPHYKNKA